MGSFAKLFGEGEDQVLVVIRPDPAITITIRLPELGTVDWKLEYHDTDEGHDTCREKFNEIDEKSARKLAKVIRKQFGA